jgi:hypothetical protein
MEEENNMNTITVWSVAVYSERDDDNNYSAAFATESEAYQFLVDHISFHDAKVDAAIAALLKAGNFDALGEAIQMAQISQRIACYQALKAGKQADTEIELCWDVSPNQITLP